MPIVHFLNVGDGDCSIIQHGSERATVIDICNGESAAQKTLKEALAKLGFAKTGGNYGMRNSPTEPIAYMKGIGIDQVFRFILSHPDMDHMDGFKALCDDVGILNFWDSGVRKTKPDFSKGKYREEDWDKYVDVRDARCAGTKVVTPHHGARFQYANNGEPNDVGDCIDIVSPNSELVAAANEAGDANDASYVLIYRSCGGKIIFPGDAHDSTWEFVLENYEDKVKDCTVLIAPHHGRDSGASFDFLDVLKPKLTLFGCANSEHLAYDKWNSRDLLHITNNQAGNIILNATSEGIEVFVENIAFAQTYKNFDTNKTLHGCYYIGLVA